MRIRAIRGLQSADRSVVEMARRRVGAKGIRLSLALRHLVGVTMETKPEGVSFVEVGIPVEIKSRPSLRNAGRLFFPTQEMANSSSKEVPEAQNASPTSPFSCARPPSDHLLGAMEPPMLEPLAMSGFANVVRASRPHASIPLSWFFTDCKSSSGGRRLSLGHAWSFRRATLSPPESSLCLHWKRRESYDSSHGRGNAPSVNMVRRRAGAHEAFRVATEPGRGRRLSAVDEKRHSSHMRRARDRNR